MLLALILVLLVLAIAGGVVVHPLLFAVAILALLLVFGDRYGARRRPPF